MTTATGTMLRRLYVVWRHPETRKITPIGLLLQRGEGDDVSYTFGYLEATAGLDGFNPLPGLAALEQRYDSATLFPVFANRLMPRDRSDFPDYLHRLDLQLDADPFEVLERSGGSRATDRIEVFAGPERTDAGDATSLFFVRGIRHLDGATEAVNSLQIGDQLVVCDDPDNPVNARALLLAGGSAARVGWVPVYLVGHIHDLRRLIGVDPTFTVEHVNDPNTAPHMRVLCRVTASWPIGYTPFSSAEFQTVVNVDESSIADDQSGT